MIAPFSTGISVGIFIFFFVTDERKQRVLDNIRCLLDIFLSCSPVESVLLAWVMHEQAMIDAVSSGITEKCEIRSLSLVCSADFCDD